MKKLLIILLGIVLVSCEGASTEWHIMKLQKEFEVKPENIIHITENNFILKKDSIHYHVKVHLHTSESILIREINIK